MKILLPSATQLRQGYVFTGVCDAVHRRCVADTPPWADIPTLLGRHLPGRHHPPGQTPPPHEMATAADGRHPTGMHSCFDIL